MSLFNAAFLLVFISNIVITVSLDCHFGKTERYKKSAEIRKQSSGRIECDHRSQICARIHFRGTQKENGRLVSGHHASCLNASECVEYRPCALNRLQDLSVGNDLEITRCKAVCCEGNMCNHHNQRSNPDWSPLEPLQCYVGYVFADSNGVTQDKKVDVRTCGYSSAPSRLDRSSRCLTKQITETNVDTNDIIFTTILECSDANICIDACDTFEDTYNSDEEMKVSCKANCCRDHLCNSSSMLKVPTILLATLTLLPALIHNSHLQNCF